MNLIYLPDLSYLLLFISTDTLYLMPAMSLGRFCSRVNYNPLFPWLQQLKMVCDIYI
jgi:hypothetical protein